MYKSRLWSFFLPKHFFSILLVFMAISNIAQAQPNDTSRVDFRLSRFNLSVELPVDQKSDNYPTFPVNTVVDINDRTLYNERNDLMVLKKTWEYEKSFSGKVSGSLGLEIWVSALAGSNSYDPGDLKSLEIIVSQQVRRNADDVIQSLVKRGLPHSTKNFPAGFTIVAMGGRNWVHYSQGSANKIFIAPLDRKHFVKFVFLFASNSQTNSWKQKATEDMVRVLSSVAITNQ